MPVIAKGIRVTGAGVRVSVTKSLAGLNSGAVCSAVKLLQK